MPNNTFQEASVRLRRSPSSSEVFFWNPPSLVSKMLRGILQKRSQTCMVMKFEIFEVKHVLELLVCRSLKGQHD